MAADARSDTSEISPQDMMKLKLAEWQQRKTNSSKKTMWRVASRESCLGKENGKLAYYDDSKPAYRDEPVGKTVFNTCLSHTPSTKQFGMPSKTPEKRVRPDSRHHPLGEICQNSGRTKPTKSSSRANTRRRTCQSDYVTSCLSTASDDRALKSVPSPTGEKVYRLDVASEDPSKEPTVFPELVIARLECELNCVESEAEPPTKIAEDCAPMESCGDCDRLDETSFTVYDDDRSHMDRSDANLSIFGDDEPELSLLDYLPCADRKMSEPLDEVSPIDLSGREDQDESEPEPSPDDISEPEEEDDLRRKIRKHSVVWRKPDVLDMEDHLSRYPNMTVFWFFEMRDRQSRRLAMQDWDRYEEALAPIYECPSQGQRRLH